MLGLQATAAWRVSSIVVSPQLFFDWRHEFIDSRPHLTARFVQDSRSDPQEFNIALDRPDPDVFDLGGGVVFLLGRGIQPYVYAQTLLGDKYFDSQIVGIGVRVNL
jgi:hypothetical protein